MKTMILLFLISFSVSLWGNGDNEEGIEKKNAVIELIETYKRNESRFKKAAEDSIKKHVLTIYNDSVSMADLEYKIIPKVKFKENINKLDYGDDIYQYLELDTSGLDMYIVVKYEGRIYEVCSRFYTKYFFCSGCYDVVLDKYLCKNFEIITSLSEELIVFFKYSLSRFIYSNHNKLYFMRKYPDEENYSNELNEFFWNRYTEEEVNKWLERENKEE